MDIFLIIGIISGFLSVVVGMIVKGADVSVLINPAAIIIIFGGSVAALINSYPMSQIKRLPKIFGVLFSNKEIKNDELIQSIIEMANMARRDGLLALESQVNALEDPFLKKGLEMVVDGIDAEQIREILETEIAGIEERHHSAAAMFKTLGSTSPTLGVLGAVIGLIGALGNLSDVEALGHMIKAAFVATLYGIFFGYVIMIPFASRLNTKSADEIQQKMIILEGVMAIQAGHSPKNIEKQLNSIVAPDQRKES